MVEEEKVKTINLNIMLLKNCCNLNNREDYIDKYSEKNIIKGGKSNDSYFLYKNGRGKSKPSWVLEFDEKVLDGIKDSFEDTSSEGLSVIKQINYKNINYLFSINFGQGWRNIKKDKIEDTFGIYTTIAIIEEGAKIRRAGTRNISSNPKNTEFQHAFEITNETFNSELEDNDIIRHLNATADTSTISSVIGKYGPLNIRMRFKESEIPCWDYLDDRLLSLLEQYLKIQTNERIINKYFKGLRPLPSAKQKELNDNLDSKILEDTSKFFLFEPEIDYDPTIISSIKYKLKEDSRASETYENLKLEDYLVLRESKMPLNLNEDKVFLINEDGKKCKEWTILKCLYGEIKQDNQVYILSNSVWYGMSNDKYERINKNIKAIQEDFYIDDCTKESTQKSIMKQKLKGVKQIANERIFNTALCKQLSGELFDEISQQITIDGDKMEVCDIFNPKEKEFIHSKISSDAAKLSHLFNQGYVSARAFASMKEQYVSLVNEKMKNEEHKLDDSQNSHQKYTIRYLIINGNTKNRLTFISKLALDKIITDLKGFGYNVKLSWVNQISL